MQEKKNSFHQQKYRIEVERNQIKNYYNELNTKSIGNVGINFK